MKIAPNTSISHYKILSEIGKGGMGEVYLAEDTELDRKVAIKFLSEEFSEDSEQLSRFVQEAKAASALNHPNIITIHQIGKTDDARFIALEYIEGETLTNFLKNPLKLDSALDIATQIASALDAAHSAGIVHRDIKPDNVMIRNDGLVKILDFGIAKLTEKRHGDEEARGAGEEDKTLIAASPESAIPAPPETTPGMIIGTANYMSPEQAKGQEIDARTDIFSFGVLLYVMISGHLPFEGESPMEIISSILKDEPKKLRMVHPELEQIIARSLRKDRDERYGEMNELLVDLQTLKKRIEFEAELERTSSPDPKVEAETEILNARTEPGIESKTTGASRNSIAVMPFEHLSSEDDNEYFCDGLAEELINALARIENLEVAARSSSFSFKGKNAPAGEIATSLNVKNILEGSVRKAGSRLRISVQLVNAADGYQIWSERYDRELDDIFDVQDEIALAVVEVLKVKLIAGEKEAVLKRYTSNAAAYELYLKGRFFFAKRTAEGFEKAIMYYQRAIEIDSEYALAYSGLADCHILSGFYEFTAPVDALELAAPQLEKALQLEDSLAEIYTSLALSQVSHRDLNGADKSLRKSISLNPKYAYGHHVLSCFRIFLNRFEEAIEIEARAIALEPLASIYLANLGWWYHFARRYDEAIGQAFKATEVDPGHFLAYWILGLAYGEKRDFDKALAALQKASDLTDGSPFIVAEVGRLLGKMGNRAEALKIFKDLETRSENEYISPLNFAKIHAGLGQTEDFFGYLQKAVDDHSLRLFFYLREPSLDEFRGDPRFRDVLRRMNMPVDEPADTSGRRSQTDESLEASTVMLNQESTKGPANDFTANPAARKQKPYKNSNRDWQIAGILSILIVVFGLAAHYFFNGNSNSINSIAVMPFVNESGNEDIEYLSDGMTETLINSLSQIPGLNVKARSLVFRYKGKEISPKKVASELDVQAILTGRLIQRGDQLTLNIELIDGSTEYTIWGNSYGRQASDLVALQGELARDVSSRLKSRLSGDAAARVKYTHTADPEAFRLYLKGRYGWNRRTTVSLKQAAEFFKKAIEKDPNYALAYASLAETYALFLQYDVAAAKDCMPQLKAAAERALELDDSLAAPHVALEAYYSYYKFDRTAAEREIRRAIELDPNYATAHQWLGGDVLVNTKRFDEAIASLRRAEELDPLSPIIGSNLGDAMLFAGRYDDAISQYKRVRSFDPGFGYVNYGLGLAYWQKGMTQEAIAATQKYIELSDAGLGKGNLGFFLAKSGKRNEAVEILEELKQQVSSQKHVHYPIAIIYLGLGDKEKALDWLEKEVEGFGPQTNFYAINPELKELRDEPRFKALLKRLGLPGS